MGDRGDRSVSADSVELLGLNVSFDKVKKTKIFQKFLEEEKKEQQKGSPIKNSRRSSLQQEDLENSNNNYNRKPKSGNNSQGQSPDQNSKLRKQYYSPDSPTQQLKPRQQPQMNPYLQTSDLQQQQQFQPNFATTLQDNQFDSIPYNQSQFISPQQQQHPSQLQSQRNPRFQPPGQMMGRAQSPEQELQGYSQLIPQQQQSMYDNGNNLPQSMAYSHGVQVQPQMSVNPMQIPAHVGSTQDPNKSLDFAVHASLPNDIFELKSWIIDLRKELEAQKQKNMTQEAKSKEQQLYLGKLKENQQQFRDRILSENQQDRIEMLNSQDAIQNLQERIFELQRDESNLKLDNDKLRNKIEHDSLLKIRQEEELRESNFQVQELNDQINQRNRDLENKNGELIQEKSNYEALKLKNQGLEQQLEQLQEFQKKSNGVMAQEQEQQEITIKRLNDYTIKIQQMQQEIDRQKQENFNLQKMFQDKNAESESYKNEIYNQKSQNLEKNQKEINLQVQLESAHLEIQQLKSLLVHSEMEMRNVKDHNAHLLQEFQKLAHQKGFDLNEQYTQFQNSLKSRESLLKSDDNINIKQDFVSQSLNFQKPAKNIPRTPPNQSQEAPQQQQQPGGRYQYTLNKGPGYGTFYNKAGFPMEREQPAAGISASPDRNLEIQNIPRLNPQTEYHQKQQQQQNTVYQNYNVEIQQNQVQTTGRQNLTLDEMRKASISPTRTGMVKPRDQGVFYRGEQDQQPQQQNQNQNQAGGRGRINDQNAQQLADYQQQQLERKLNLQQGRGAGNSLLAWNNDGNDQNQEKLLFVGNNAVDSSLLKRHSRSPPRKSQIQQLQEQEYQQQQNLRQNNHQQQQQFSQSQPYYPQQQQQQQQQQYAQTLQYNNNNNQLRAQRGESLDSELMLLQMEKQGLETEFKKLEDSKTRTGSNIRRKKEVERELDLLTKSISSIKLQIKNQPK